MTLPDQVAVRDLIALCVKDRYGLGMDLPPHWRNWNFIGMALYFPLLDISIEGEPGFDPRIIDRGREVARDYIRYGISTMGSGKEGIGYHTAGMGHLDAFALALANRDVHLLTMAHYRRMLDNWLLWTMQPYGREWASNGDLGTFAPGSPVLQSGRFLFPSDPILKLIADQAPPVSRLDTRVPEQALLQLLAPVDLGAARIEGKPPVFPAGLPLSQYDAERGVLFVRSAWTPDAMALQFHARSDTTFPSHDHSDRGEFFLTALGQAWSVPPMRETESKHHSIVTIDGLGQGFFAPPARWVEIHEGPAAVTATVDLSYCYDWRWMKSSFLASDDQLKKEPWLETFREARDRLLARIPREKWERDPSPAVRAYYEPYLSSDPRMWGAEDSWVLRTPYNPVEKAFRSIAFVRGESPFLILADDIRKDDRERYYEWRMILPMNVEAYEIKGGDIILGPVTGNHLPPRPDQPSYKDVGKPVRRMALPCSSSACWISPGRPLSRPLRRMPWKPSSLSKTTTPTRTQAGPWAWGGGSSSRAAAWSLITGCFCFRFAPVPAFRKHAGVPPTRWR